MADKQDYEDDGYQFTDPDSMDNPPTGSAEYYHDPLEINPSESDENTRLNSELGISRSEGKKNVMRNAIIVVFIIVFLMIIYSYIWPLFNKEPEITPVKTQVVEPAPIKKTESKPVAIESPKQMEPAVHNMEEKLGTLEQGQQTARMEVTSLSNQVSGLNNNVNEMNAQVSKMNQILLQLSNTVTEQAQVIAALNMQLQQAKKPAPVVVRQHPKKARRTYFIQAVVPGRAWLVATNGSTLTVREGNNVPGYGIVKLIDAQQGRVLTGSGQVIRFSPEDS